MELTGKTAIVTGGGSGIGLACARALLRREVDVVICGRTPAKLEMATRVLADQLGRAPVAVEADVSRTEDVERLLTTTVERFGGVDILVNNAGISAKGRVAELDDETFDRALATNLRGAFLCSRAAWPHLAVHGEGAIVNIASYAGKKGMAGSGAYCASKFGLVGLSQAMSEEGKADGIRVSAICPAYVATPMVAGSAVSPDAMLQPEDIAQTLLWFLSLSPAAVVNEVVLNRVGA